MYPDQLIGKKAIRIKHIVIDEIVKDKSFMNEVILIVDANKTNITYRFVNDETKKEYHLNSKWIDDNWIEYKE